MPDYEDEDHYKIPRDDKVARLTPDGPVFYSIAQRHLRGRVEREWLIDDLIPRRSVVILSGWSSVGKTHIANDLMYDVCFGEPFAGYDVKRRCGAVLFAAEGQDDVIPRWDALECAKIWPWFEQRDLPKETFYPLHWTDQVPRLTAPDALKQYSQAIEAVISLQRAAMGATYRGLGLAIVDTVSAAADLVDDQHNAAGVNQTIFNMLHQLAKNFDLCVMVIDHLGKDLTKGTRGSTAKEASADVVLRVTGNVSEEGIVSNCAMTVSKMRGGGSYGRRFPFKLVTVKLPSRGGKREEGVRVEWDTSGMPVAAQNKRHGTLMRAIDEALLEKFQWVRLGRNLNFKAADSDLVWVNFKLSAAATAEKGAARETSIRKNFNRAMKDSSEHGLIGQKTLADETVLVWRTDHKFPDSSKVSEE